MTAVIAAAGAVVEGYASLFGRLDLGRDRILPGAFRRSLARRGAGGVKLLWQHDPGRPIGRWTEIAEDGVGLKVRGRLLPEVAQGREALALIRAGALDGLSIGFRTVRARHEPATGVRELVEIDLWEISLVTFPQMPGARLALAGAQRPAAHCATGFGMPAARSAPAGAAGRAGRHLLSTR